MYFDMLSINDIQTKQTYNFYYIIIEERAIVIYTNEKAEEYFNVVKHDLENKVKVIDFCLVRKTIAL